MINVDKIKVFVFYILNSYQSLLQKNWNNRISKFEHTRTLDSLMQRVEIVRLFALSRIYYIASVLPLSKTIAGKIDRIIGKFIWSGKILRVSNNDMKLPLLGGGLNLTSVFSMANTLRLSSLLRLVKSEVLKSIGHFWFWIGECMVDFLPNLTPGQHAKSVPAFFESLALLFQL